MPRLKITSKRVELVLVVAGCVGLWVVFYLCGAGPIGSDELLYINIGLNPFSDPYILNRYTHVYLQQFFLALLPHPLDGVRAFEASVLVATSLLIYINARKLIPGSSFLHGLLALGLFFSAGYWGQLIGAPLIDFTTMLMLMIFVAIYLKAAASGFEQRNWVIALGFIFFLGFKTKESFLVVSVLLVGMGIAENDNFRISRLGRNLLRFSIGFLAGVFLLILLNAIILKNPLFGLRPTDFKTFQNIFMTASAYSTNPGNWYRMYLFEDILTPFLLFLLAGVTMREKLPIARRLIWLVPLALVVFLTGTLIRSTWGVEVRYFIPAWPIVCVLGAHFIDFTTMKDHKSWLIFGATVLAGLVGLGLARLVIIQLTQAWGWMMSNFLETIIAPILLSILLATHFISRRQPLGNALILVCLLGLVIYPVAHNAIQIIHREARLAVEARYYPLSAFETELQPDENMIMYVSEGVLPNLEVQEDNELMMLVNSYFGSNTTKENYRIGENRVLFQTDWGTVPIHYILLSAVEYEALTTEAKLPEGLETITEPKGLYILLKSGQ